MKPVVALYMGGMGAKDQNFHKQVFDRMGYESISGKVQELFLAGDRDAAFQAVPDDLADGIALCGPLPRIRERMELWRQSPVTTLLVGGVTEPAVLRSLADMVR